MQYIASIRFGSRVFEPRPFTTVLAIALIAGFVSLGLWQLRRADEKRALYAAFAAGTDATRRIDARTPSMPRYQHVEASGSYDSGRQILIDNMSNAQGRAGYYVITPFALRDGGWVLINRGWVPVGANRAEKPRIEVSPAPREVRGRADNLPRAGIRLGNGAALAPPYPVVANFPTRGEIAQLLHESVWTAATDVVLLDAALPDGYVRDWQPPGFPAVRHIAYAVQWFGLALALTVIYAVTNLRRVPGTQGPA
jgi:surfeit locus 1 family protein